MRAWKPTVALALVLFVLFAGCTGGEVVEEGDTVSVRYVGKLSDGKVFDTNIREVAEDDSIPKAFVFNKRQSYESLNFTVGAGQVIPGFEEGIIGMKVGEEKTITLQPEEAYGKDDPSMIEVLPKQVEQPIRETHEITKSVSRQAFTSNFQTEPEVGATYTLSNGVNLTVTKVGGENVTIKYDLERGDTVSDPAGRWNDTVVAANDTHFTVRHEVREGEVYEEAGYPWTVRVTEVGEENFTVRRVLDEGPTYVNTFGGPREVRENETSIIIDFNQPLAGETLTFDVEVVGLEKANTTSSQGGQ